MKKLIITADMHFDTKFPYSTSTNPLLDIFFCNSVRSFLEILRYAVVNNCDILFAGDFFNEGSIGAPELHIVVKLLKQASDKGVELYINLGNHDLEFMDKIPTSIESLSLLFPNMNSASTSKPWSVYEWEGRSIYLVPFYNEAKFNSVFEQMMEQGVKSKSILCLHEDIKGIRMGRATMKSGMTDEDLFLTAKNKFDLIVCGHMHHHYDSVKHGVPFVIPGSTNAIDFRDEGTSKGFYVSDFSNGVRLEWVDFKDQVEFKTLNAEEINSYLTTRTDLRQMYFKVKASVGTSAEEIKKRLEGAIGLEMDWQAVSKAPDLTGYERPSGVTVDEWLKVYMAKKGYSLDEYEEAQAMNDRLFNEQSSSKK